MIEGRGGGVFIIGGNPQVKIRPFHMRIFSCFPSTVLILQVARVRSESDLVTR